MTSAEARSQFDEKLKKMRSAHDALLAKLSDDTLREYVDSCNSAREAFAALVVAGFERVREKNVYANLGKGPL